MARSHLLRPKIGKVVVVRLAFRHPYEGPVFRWTATEQEALDILAKESRNEDVTPTSIDFIRVPTERTALIEWLNQNAPLDARPEDYRG